MRKADGFISARMMSGRWIGRLQTSDGRYPNKIKNLMGITAEVNLMLEVGKHFIENIVQPYSVPISLRGRYYYCSAT
jgi:hypothetical protein